MITVKIGEDERHWANIDDVEESWINEQIIRRRRTTGPVCVVVKINTSSVNVSLVSRECVASGGGGRRPNEDEQGIFDLWNRHGRRDEHINGGDVIAFIRQLRRNL